MTQGQMSDRRHTVLVTGASSGIGRVLTGIFAREGYDLVLVARRASVLQQLAEQLAAAHGVRAVPIVEDLSLPAAATHIIERIREAGLTIDVLVNNAGFAVHGYFVETDLGIELNMMQVNMVTLTQLTKLYVGEMRARGSGRVLNVASTAAFQPGPRMAVYYASKAYVLSFSEALNEELRGSGVTVTALCPGLTRTNFQQRAGIEHTWLMRSGFMDASRVAEIGFRGLMSGKAVVIPGWRNRFFAWCGRVMPRILIRPIVARLHAGR